MSDPLSVAGGAAGVVSLGLTVCQGLLAYYRPFKSFQEEIDNVTCRIEALEGILKALQNVLFANASVLAFSDEPVNSAVDSILRCQKGLRTLEKMLKNCSATKVPQNLFGSKLQTSRILYPFRRETLMSLMETITWLQENVNTALNVLGIAVMLANNRQMSMVASSSAYTDQVLDVVHHLDQRHAGFDNRLSMIEQHLNRVESNIHRHGTRPILDPTLLRSLMDTQQNLDGDIRSLVARARPQRRHSPARCTCSRTRLSSFHDSACQLESQSRMVLSLHTRRTFCSRLLSFSLLASLTVTKGAGGFSISPSVRFLAVVPPDSPAFRLLNDAGRKLRLQRDKTVIEHSHRRLLELFQDGEASPRDTRPDGNTILHVVTGWQTNSHWDAYSCLSLRALINSLLERGSLPDRVNDRGETPADNLTRYFRGFMDSYQQQATIEICSDLLHEGGYMTHSALDRRYHRGVLNVIYHCDGIDILFEDYSIRLLWQLADRKGLQDINLPEELVPLLSRSTDLLCSLLRKGIDMKKWFNSYLQWPAGLVLLLQAGYTPGPGALRAACETDCEASVKILIDTRRFHLRPDELKVASFHHNPAMAGLVVQALIDRRKQLQSLAETYLPEGVVSQLGIRPNRLLNRQAYKAYQLLKAIGVDVSNVQEEREWSVYDNIGVNVKFADRLWDAGFQDVDEVDDIGGTSLTKLQWTPSQYGPAVLLEMANWLITKGAAIDCKASPNSSVLCLLGETIGWRIYLSESVESVASELSQMSGSCKDPMRKILLDNTRDACCCPYAFAGCSGLTRFLTEIFRPRNNRPFDELVDRLAVTLEKLTTTEPQQHLGDELAPGILRFITCYSLDVSHTCDHDLRTGIEPDEVREIQDDEKHLILDLDELSAEFLSKYKEFDVPLSDFVKGYWWTEMNAILSSRETPSEEYVRQVRGIGVVLDE